MDGASWGSGSTGSSALPLPTPQEASPRSYKVSGSSARRARGPWGICSPPGSGGSGPTRQGAHFQGAGLSHPYSRAGNKSLTPRGARRPPGSPHPLWLMHPRLQYFPVHLHVLSLDPRQPCPARGPRSFSKSGGSHLSAARRENGPETHRKRSYRKNPAVGLKCERCLMHAQNIIKNQKAQKRRWNHRKRKGRRPSSEAPGRGGDPAKPPSGLSDGRCRQHTPPDPRGQAHAGHVTLQPPPRRAEERTARMPETQEALLNSARLAVQTRPVPWHHGSRQRERASRSRRGPPGLPRHHRAVTRHHAPLPRDRPGACVCVCAHTRILGREAPP